MATPGSPTHWVKPGIEPASSQILVGFVSTVPQWELPVQLIFFLTKHIMRVNLRTIIFLLWKCWIPIVEKWTWANVCLIFHTKFISKRIIESIKFKTTKLLKYRKSIFIFNIWQKFLRIHKTLTMKRLSIKSFTLQKISVRKWKDKP